MITLEQVDQLRKRTNCSYEEAKALLEKHNGNVLEAIVDFEQSKNRRSYVTDKKPQGKQMRDFWKGVQELIQKGFATRVMIEDRNSILLNVSVNIMLLLIIIMPPVTIPILLIMIILGYKINIRKQAGGDVNLTSMVQDVADKFTGRNHSEKPHPTAEEEVVDEDKNDDYNEMTIE